MLGGAFRGNHGIWKMITQVPEKMCPSMKTTYGYIAVGRTETTQLLRKGYCWANPPSPKRSKPAESGTMKINPRDACLNFEKRLLETIVGPKLKAQI